MLKTYKNLFIWAAAALICIVMLTVQSQAAEYKMGPGDHYDSEGNIIALDGTVLVKADGTVLQTVYTTLKDAAEANASIGNAEISDSVKTAAAGSSAVQNAVSSGEAAAAKAYTYAKNYKLTDEGGNKVYTFEGKKYTRSTLYGTRCLTGYAAEEAGTSGTYSGNTAKAAHTVAAPSDLPIGTVIIVEGLSGPYAGIYDGMYVVEDRGGALLENQGLIDIFFNTAAEAAYVTDAGWNMANIWIAEPVK